MSFFYLTAVKGDLPVHLLEIIIARRLDYLKSVLNSDNIVYNEYVVDGSVYDNVGHFMLCVVSILGKNTEFSEFILKAELELFRRRLGSLTAYDIRGFAKKLLRNIKKQEYFPSYIQPLQVLCQHLIIKNLVHHITYSHTSKCSVYKIKLSFRHCLGFVAKRDVELHNGTAFIPCNKWKQYLSMLYSTHIKHRFHETNLSTLKSDPRIKDLLQKVQRDYFPYTSTHSSVLLSKNVDHMLKYFPPCMLNLHLSLRRKHRLSHSQRFYYSLFLKDIGMPVEEAVDFWREEYRQSPNGSHGCCHNWDKDEKKYLYGIRHMYGLEGGRKKYTSVNCQRIQSIDNACTEGGCPFKSFDNSKILPLLENPSEELISQLNIFRMRNENTKSCLMYLKSFVETADCDNLSFNLTPVKYYTIASKVD